MLLRGILSPLRLPIPPQRRYLVLLKTSRYQREVFLEAPPRFELGVKALQARALPLGYGATAYSFGEKPLIKKMERETRFELATFALARRRSTTEPFPHSATTFYWWKQ